MKGVIIFLAGVVAGGVSGYLAANKKAKKDMEKRLKAVEDTYKDLKERFEKKSETAESAEEVKNESTESTAKAPEGGSVEHSEEEKADDADSEGSGSVSGPYVRYSTDEETHPAGQTWDEFYEDYYGDDEETIIAMQEFQREIAEYAGTGQSYNITGPMYDRKDDGYKKRVMIIDDTGEYDRAFDADTGEEIKNWADLTMAEDHDTINENKCDEFGRLFVRCEAEKTDFEIKFARWEVPPPWVDDIEDDGTD